MSSLMKSLLRTAPTATSRIEAASDVPATFIGFCDWIGIRLSAGQAEFARVAFDGDEPVDRDVALRIFGDIAFGALPVGVRDVVAGVCGGRGGKSYLLVAVRMVWGMFVRDLSSLADGQRAVALVVAPNDELRQEVVNYALGVVRSKDELRSCLRLPRGTKDDDVVSQFSIRRRDGHMVTFRGGVATAGGYGGRGKSLTDFAMDEAAFFRDKSSKVNDEDIFKAANPRVLPGGQSLVMSTPWAQAGLLWDLYSENFGKPSTALVAQAPTLVLRSDEWVQRIVERETRRDPDNAEREFGAKFMTVGTTIFFSQELLQACVDEGLSPDEPRAPRPGDQVSAGGDLGFRSNSSALAITHLSDGKLLLGELVEVKPEPGQPLRPKATIRRFAERMKAHGISVLMGDQHYRETADEELAEAGLSFVDAPALPDEVYVRARQKMREGIVRFPKHEKLLRQLKEVQGRPIPGGRMQIILPRWAKGEHGDLVAAFVLGLWQLVAETVAAQEPEKYSQEWEAAERERRRKEHAEKQEKSFWQRGERRGAYWR